MNEVLGLPFLVFLLISNPDLHVYLHRRNVVDGKQSCKYHKEFQSKRIYVKERSRKRKWTARSSIDINPKEDLKL